MGTAGCRILRVACSRSGPEYWDQYGDEALVGERLGVGPGSGVDEAEDYAEWRAGHHELDYLYDYEGARGAGPHHDECDKVRGFNVCLAAHNATGLPCSLSSSHSPCAHATAAGALLVHQRC